MYFRPLRRDAIADSLETQDDVLFWITEWDGASVAEGDRLVLREAIWLDQFADPQADVPSERFPLVSSYQVGGTRNSRILFGSGGNVQRLRLEFGFAMPVPIGSAAADEGTIGGAVGLGALLPTRHDVGADLIRPESVLFGPSDNQDPIGQNWAFGTYAIAHQNYPGKVIVGSSSRALPHAHSMLDAIGLLGSNVTTTGGPTRLCN